MNWSDDRDDEQEQRKDERATEHGSLPVVSELRACVGVAGECSMCLDVLARVGA